MDIAMRVHRVSSHPVEVSVEYNGEPAKAMLPELEVELYDPDITHGTVTLRFRKSQDIAAARSLFGHGGMVTLTVSAQPPAVISTEAVPESATETDPA